MSKTYVALIADAIASRDLPPAGRARLQADARAAVKHLNQRYRRVLAARFAVTLGDELQCLFPTSPSSPPRSTASSTTTATSCRGWGTRAIACSAPGKAHRRVDILHHIGTL